MKERVLIVGSGAREHAIAAAVVRAGAEVICFGSARNPGIDALSAKYMVGKINDGAAVAAFAKEHGATLAVIGPEAPLAAGVADALWAAGVKTVGPTKSLARIESSKGFARELLAKHGIPGNPFFRRFDSMNGVEEVLRAWDMRHVIKDDGLAGGKGVKVCGDHLHSLANSMDCCRELVALGHPFVIEERLEGEEFSLMSFCDGNTLQHMPAVQDHKRADNGDKGPNTGGMGTYTDANGKLPFLADDDLREAKNINQLVAAALEKECGEPYRGILYGGFMATRDGVKLIEYNARFGDPECLNVLTLLKTDVLRIFRGVVDQTLADFIVEFESDASVCKYVVPDGYPDQPRVGDEVVLPNDLPQGVTMYLGAVDVKDGELVATGSRTVGVVGVAETIADAENICENVVQEIPGRFFHRADIGTAELIAKRVEHMKAVRS